MSDPLGRQEAVLAALDEQIAHWKRMASRYAVIQQTIKAAEDNQVAVGLEGRRRIIQRHAPAGPADCEQCGRDSWNAPVWPCPDWLDATAGLEEGRTDG